MLGPGNNTSFKGARRRTGGFTHGSMISHMAASTGGPIAKTIISVRMRNRMGWL